MLAIKLTESLQRHLLWKHQENRRTANAVLKHRHTGVHAMKSDTGTIVYSAASEYVAKMNLDKEVTTREH